MSGRISHCRVFFFVIMLNLAGSLAVAAADDAAPPRPRSTHEHVFLEAAAKERGAKALLKRTIVATPNQELYDVHHYFIDMTINDDARLMTSTVTTTAEVVGDSISELELNMYSGLTIVSATVDGSPAVGYNRIPGEDMITVLLGRDYFQGETVAVGVKYQVDALWLSGAGHFNWYTYNGQSMISTYSEPDGAHTWWPCKDVISDKADSLDFRLNVAEGQIVASNGRLVTDFNFGDWHRYYWKTNYPISTYLVSLAIYPYETYSDWYTPLAGGDPMEVPFFVYPDNIDSVQTTYAQTVPMLEAYAAAFGEYPFIDEKYGHAEFLEGGGMEHQTISSLGGWDEDLIAHEVSHQWWGNMVTCADHSHIWLNEGMAMWSEAYWMGERYGFEEYKAHLAGISYFGPGTVIVEDPANEEIYFYGLTYFKAGWVIHMLRGVLGDADFFAGLAQYRANHAYGNATTADLQAAMEAASGRDLTTFFQQWIYEEYFPVYRMSWVPGPGAGEITVTIEQTQENGGLFEMPVPLRIVTDVSTTDVKVENNQLSQQFVIPVDGTVSSVSLDPDRWILSPYPLTDATLAQGVLLVNGVDWTTYDGNHDGELTAAYEARAFSGTTPIMFWDAFPEPATGYPWTLPAPLGHGSVPAEVLGKFSTVIWVGNNYQGDIYEWIDTPIRQYLEAGGNVLLLSRYTHVFLGTGLDAYLGVEFAENQVTLTDCTALAPGLVDIPLVQVQTWNDLFTETVGPNTTPLFKDNVNFPTRLTGALVEPPMGGAYRADGGRFAVVGGRPYRMDPVALSMNVTAILAIHFGEPYTPSAVPGDGAGSQVPGRTVLGTPYPNPFNPQVKIPFELARQGEISLDVFDVRGRLIRHVAAGDYVSGPHTIIWDGADDSGRSASSGTYFLKLRDSQGQEATSRLVLVK